MKSKLKYYGKTSFLLRIKDGSSILDVGCGNNSPKRAKEINNTFVYTGIDVSDYCQEYAPDNFADKYLIFKPNQFSESIEKLNDSYDVVISAHNLEHCDNMQATLCAILKKINSSGYLYLSFPCEESVFFPKREGTLNYYDDPTHQNEPPNFKNVIETITKRGFRIEKKVKRYRPLILNIFGLLIEPISKIRKKVMFGTWEKWGFESIIIAKKIN